MVWSWCLKQLSHHQTCATGVSSILWNRVLPRWCGCTCPWCPHTQTQSDLLHRTSATQISSKHKELATITSSLLVFILQTFQRKMFSFSVFLPDSFFHHRLEQAGDGQRQIWVVTGNICQCWVFTFLEQWDERLDERHQLLHDGLQKIQAWLDFLLRVGGFYHRAHSGDVHPVGSHIVRVGHHRYVNICMDNPEKVW